jgi:hypothetical protein
MRGKFYDLGILGVFIHHGPENAIPKGQMQDAKPAQAKPGHSGYD